MTGRRDEIEAFKTIDLRAYAADAFGYELDAKASSPSSALMRGPAGNKIVIAVDRRDGHFVYFSVGDPSDSGSIIDFCQKRGVGSLGQVRKALRPYLGQPGDLPPRARFERTLEPIERDIAAVRAAVSGMHALHAGLHPYLNKRGLSPATISHRRFADRIRLDNRGNAVFVHLNREGICGFELKNDGFTGFAKGGTKGAFASTIREDDDALVLAESAIDLLSHAQMFGCDRRRFMSLGGQVSPEQATLVRVAMEKLPSGTVILAFDNDDAGRALTDKFRATFEAVGRAELSLRMELPEIAGQDWNDVLRESASAANRRPPPEPGVG